ncbi:acetylornithine/succinyldiaminopimelate/putrescine aminotransferase [Saccharothrix carnea]|uniref:Acetylornithine/succinyldiaminopimelate/putresci ne aminotransferase n=1 Tax=Saccharothrix carnea TaxID=1280637 RepID=A0A2P8HQZ0_SACCR|nr:aminotransferase class III-fold pyridoxal phosphate-dependent enzyme [Saccharothrix carnea]PSL48631.1 acetylornithine/succinyldiaminopimelate/putrescine aminotransferase [Saccharothrix carnea]
MVSSSAAQEFADANLRAKMASLGMAIHYTRAEGNTLYYRDSENREVAVTDFVGSFGSLMFGHNHPEIVARAKEILDNQTPIFTLMLGHSYANEVATALNAIVRRELGTDEPYYGFFANSGAEGVEVVIKHAEFDRQARAAELIAEVEANLEAARTAVADGAVIADDAFDSLGLAAAEGIDGLVAEVARANAEVAALPPVFLALERAFHGKLVASVNLTYNPDLRLPFTRLGPRARFVPSDAPDRLREVVAEERRQVFDVQVADGVVSVVRRDFPVFAGFFVEPIRGEAGIKPVNAEYAREIERVCAELDCPIVLDEIQSGMGRTGTFFASTHIGLRGDYYVLAKSLGGGIAKTSAVLVRERRYRKDFELLHSSTFAKDSFSSLIALKVLELLEAEDGEAYRKAAERGERLTEMLTGLWKEYPDVIKEVRGRGLMLGVEFQDQLDASSPAIRGIAEEGFLGFGIASYLLREHKIRTFPTASATTTLRLEPSIHLTDAEIEKLDTALRDLCALVHAQDDRWLAQA